jgi:cytochrome c6
METGDEEHEMDCGIGQEAARREIPCARGGKNRRSLAMTNLTRSRLLLAALLSMACTLSFAQSGEATYKAKCQMCHGPSGTPSPGMAKMMGIKPTSDPDMQKLTVDQVETTVKNGKGKMKPVAGLTDAQIRDVASYFKTLK